MCLNSHTSERGRRSRHEQKTITHSRWKGLLVRTCADRQIQRHAAVVLRLRRRGSFLKVRECRCIPVPLHHLGILSAFAVPGLRHTKWHQKQYHNITLLGCFFSVQDSTCVATFNFVFNIYSRCKYNSYMILKLILSWLEVKIQGWSLSNLLRVEVDGR